MTILRPRKNARKQSRKGSEASGFTLIEVLLAMVILAIGMAGLLPMILIAMNNNTATRQDAQAVLLAESVVDTIASRPANTDATFSVTDCRPSSLGGAQNFTVKSAVGGATVVPVSSSSMYPAGSIDFSQAASAVTAGYQMTFFTCGDTQDTTATDNTQVPFDVRWNIATATDGIKVVTVSARRMGNVVAGTGIKSALFTHPVTLRTVVGN